MVKLTRAISETSLPENSPDLRRYISAPESAYGVLQPVAPASPTPDDSGAPASLVSLSARQASNLGLLMSGTFGPPATISSNSVALTELLGSRLRARLAWSGSILYRLTWKQRVTPSGRSISALRASALTIPKAKKGQPPSNGYAGPWSLVPIPCSEPSFAILPMPLAERLATVLRTSVNDCTGWPPPNTPSGGPNVKPTATHTGEMDLEGAATLAGWCSPQARDHFPAHTPEYVAAKKAQGHGMQNLNDLAATALAPWPTSTTRDHKDGSSSGTVPENGLLGRVVWLAGWPTPMAGSPATETYNEAGNTDSSRRTVALAGWPTPCQQDGPNGGPAQGADRLPGAAAQTGSSAQTEKPGQLNPVFSLSLQLDRFATEWARCAERVTRSTLKRRPTS